MRRVLPLLLALGTLAAGGDSEIDRHKLALIRSMTPKQRAELKRRLDLIRKLPETERRRLRENLEKLRKMKPEEVRRLKAKAKRLSAKERKEYAGMASRFFTWAHGRKVLAGFPRGAFFAWLKRERPGRIEEIRAMDGKDSRFEAFRELTGDFREETIARVARHAPKHGCADPEQIRRLRSAPSPGFWKRFRQIQRECRSRRARPGPIPPQQLPRKPK